MIERRSYIPRDEFIRDYLNARRPVILTGILQPWPSLSLWRDPDYLKYRVGEQTVEVMADRDKDPLYEINCNNHRGHMQFSEYIDHTFTGTGNDCYLVANNPFLATPGGQALLADIPPPGEYLHADTTGRAHLWIGPAGTVTPLHHDVIDILLCQIVGSKRICMIDPVQKPYLYNNVGVFSDVDYERPDLNRFPSFGQVMAEEFFLNAGEALFIPDGHWHAVRSMSPSISVSFTNFIR